MDLNTLNDRLSDYLNDTSTARWSASTRDAYINIAYKKICNSENWPFRESLDTSITTVYGVAQYQLPADIQLPLGIWLNSIQAENKLENVSRLQRENFSFTSTGKPIYYFMFGGSFILYPTPDTGYNLQIEYQEKIPDLVLGTDEPIFDEDFHHLIALKAASILKRTSGGTDDKDADNLDLQYERELIDMKARLLPVTLDGKKSVSMVWDNFPVPGFLDNPF